MRDAAFAAIAGLVFAAASAIAGDYPPPETVGTAHQNATDISARKTDHKKHHSAAAPGKAEPATTARLTALRLPMPRPEVSQSGNKPEQKKDFTTASLPKPGTATADSNDAPPVPSVLADIPFDERIKIQAALLWAGDYVGTSGGEDPMLAAVKNYQKRIKSKVTGMLTPAERANLVAAAHSHEQEFGWSVVVDPATGIRIGLPTKLVPHARDTARGTRWSSAHGEVQVETFRIKDPNLKLAALFEQEKKEPATRRVEYSVLNDDSFVISGIQGLKKFSVRAKMRDGEVRGFTMLFDQMMETIVSPVMVAMASAFSPFPERSAPFAALAKSVEYGNGLVVSAHGHIITDLRLTEGCQVIVASGLGDADRVAVDKEKGLALIRVYGPRKLTPLSLAPNLPQTTDVTLVGIPDPKEQGSPAGGKKLAEIKARLADGAAIELRQPAPMAGFSGAAAVDAQGRFVGMIEMRNAVLASTKPAAPPVRLVHADIIGAFLSAHNIDAAPSAASDAKASLVRVICVRK